MESKIRAEHLGRQAYVYIRQSTARQVFENTESTVRQYALADQAAKLGWSTESVVVVDEDLGCSGSTRDGRTGFNRLSEAVAHGEVGAIFALEISRLARSSQDWQQLLVLCAVANVLVVDEQTVYDPQDGNDKLLLDLKGMHSEEIKAVFDQQAAGYDERWQKMAPIRDTLHFLLAAVLTEFSASARILCVGVGTGDEIAYLAHRFPGWTFTAVDPSRAMLDVCREKAETGGFSHRCYFHEGYVESLPAAEPFDAATCFLVSQFILDRKARVEFFQAIARRLGSGGVLVSSDLASDVSSSEYDALLNLWVNMMMAARIPPAGLGKMRAAYAKDVAIFSIEKVESIIESGGFERPVRFYQAGLIHAWFSTARGADK